MRLGLSSFTFGWEVGVRGFPQPSRPLDAFALVERAREWGVNLVQFGDNLPLHTLRDDEISRLLSEAQAKNVAIEAGARGLTEAHLARYVAIATRLEAPILRFVIDEGDYEPTPETVVGVLKNALRDLGEVRVGLENHDRFPVRVLREIVEKVGDSRVGICLDTANSLGAGEGLREVVETLAPLTLNWHIKDYRIARLPYLMGFCVTGAPAGQGMLDLEFVWQKLQNSPCQSAILELWTPLTDDFEQTLQTENAWARQSLEFLRGWKF